MKRDSSAALRNDDVLPEKKGDDGKCENGLHNRGVAAEIAFAAAPHTYHNQQMCAAALVRENAIVIPNLRR